LSAIDREGKKRKKKRTGADTQGFRFLYQMRVRQYPKERRAAFVLDSTTNTLKTTIREEKGGSGPGPASFPKPSRGSHNESKGREKGRKGRESKTEK